MPRDRATVDARRWLRATAVAALTVVGAAGLSQSGAGAGLALPPPAGVLAPPLVYAVAAALMGRRSPDRRLAWVAGACAVHLALGIATATVIAWAHPLPPAAVLPRVLWRFAPATALCLVGAPLALLAFRSRPTPRYVSRAERLAAVAAQAPRPAPPRRAAVPVPGGETAFAREARRRDAAAPAPPPPAPRPPAPEASLPVPAAIAGEPMVRVSFARIADQLPPDVFVLPLERLGESLREPNVVLVPRRLVTAQLVEGGVDVPWALVEEQFPPLAFAAPPAEVRRRFADWNVSLPLDEVLAQLPPDLFHVTGDAANVTALDFPAPFQPLAPAPATGAGEAAEPAGLSGAEEPRRVPERPAADAVATAAPAPGPAEAVAVELDETSREVLARVAAGWAPVVALEPGLLRAAGASYVGLVSPDLPQAAVADLAARVAPLLAGGRAAQVTVRTAGATVVVTAAAGAPTVVTAMKRGGATALLEMLSARAAAALAGPGAAALSRAAGRGEAPWPLPAGGGGGALAPAGIDGRLTALGAALDGFGPVAPAVFVDGARGLDVFVFHAAEVPPRPVGDLAGRVWEALVRAPAGALGPLEVAVFRDGGRHAVVCPVAAATGRAAMLAAAGPVSSPGRAQRQAAHAAATLGAA